MSAQRGILAAFISGSSLDRDISPTDYGLASMLLFAEKTGLSNLSRHKLTALAFYRRIHYHDHRDTEQKTTGFRRSPKESAFIATSSVLAIGWLARPLSGWLQWNPI